MSLPAMHTAVGMSAPFLAGAAGYLKAKRVTAKALLVLVFAMIFCGLWAEVPDFPKVLSREWSAHDPRYVNIFFFHGFLDAHQTEDRGLAEGFLAISTMFFLILFACRKSVLDNAKKIDLLGSAVAREANPPAVPKHIDYKDIVDIHCHLLPGVDDGPASVEEAIKMCRRVVELGVCHTVATPHMPWRGSYPTERIVESYNLLKKELEKEEIALRLSLGADIRIMWDLVERLKNSSVFTLARSRYFLLELDDFTVPEQLEGFMQKCNSAGFYPVLSHPERNTVFQSDITRLKDIARLPALIQVSASSLVGSEGEKARRTAVELLKAEIVHVLASDAHSVNMRLEEFRKGLIAAQDVVGPEKVRAMVVKAPGMVVHDEDIEKIKGVRKD